MTQLKFSNNIQEILDYMTTTPLDALVPNTVIPLMLARLSFSTLVFLVIFSQTFWRFSQKLFVLQICNVPHLKALI